ncbi:MAG: protein phosphatase 2C domain-containing protein [Parcubacteria group bacterium]|nr:protein phosphatase 2C domain-containing protein [Parcubacteria group bacterium]
MLDLFDVAAGSVVGRDHLREFGWRNNQDAYSIAHTDTALVAVVCDGCGSEPDSEVGAKIGAALAVQAVLDEFQWCKSGVQRPYSVESPIFWRFVRRRMLKDLRSIIETFSGDMSDIVYRYFLFTICGALIIRSENTVLFSIGDGVFFVNGEHVPFELSPGNAPPYLGYGLIRDSFSDAAQPASDFEIHRVISTQDAASILIGTDGANHLIAAEQQTLPGKHERIGPVNQFWTDDRYFRNPDAVRRRLALVNTERTVVDWNERSVSKDGGRLPDDTTLIVIRKKHSEREEDCPCT